MQVFEKTITVTEDDLDDLNHVNNVRYVQWVQDIAKDHWLAYATPEILESYAWFLVNHYIEYKSQALLGDQLILKTYVPKVDGVSTIRHVEIINAKTEQLVVLSKTKWCLIDTTTLRPTRIPPVISELF
ncbi:acyl-CoA thioester hydrolase [Winogradskyella epiphytica]|uniref:Acyl-CoA thioester hydrolase n=1 Tax=Winogradskyella epiphytica TaxID=262005 RepID=A0A2V4X7C2_9FLAO|nr:thioesterase family protein [Winogradskyella epiphytica]PYE81499.1 acyl-CoA thioester hydrolase [Winogradskyella epiphytica]GGW64737.1 thioesterase [Winogradskyella epiphytica]